MPHYVAPVAKNPTTQSIYTIKKVKITVHETYKTKFSSTTEDLLYSCILPHGHQWRYILQKYGLIKSNVCIEPTYEDGIIWIVVTGKWHAKLMLCINQCHHSLHYILIYCLLESLQLVIIKVLQTYKGTNLLTSRVNIVKHFLFICQKFPKFSVVLASGQNQWSTHAETITQL